MWDESTNTRAGVLSTTAKTRTITEAVTEQTVLLVALTSACAATVQIEDLRVLKIQAQVVARQVHGPAPAGHHVHSLPAD